MTVVREPYPFQSDSLIEFVGPADVANEVALNATDDGAACSFNVYDPGKDEEISADEAIGQTTISVTSAGIFEVGDSIELTQDDGSILSSSVSSVDAASGTVTIADATTVAAAAGNRFRVVFGSAVAMTEYGTAVYGKRDYGFRGVLADDHPVQILNQEFNVEIRFVGDPAGGLDKLVTLYGIIRPAGECSC